MKIIFTGTDGRLYIENNVSSYIKKLDHKHREVYVLTRKNGSEIRYHKKSFPNVQFVG